MENRVIKFRVWDKPTKSWLKTYFADPINGYKALPYQSISQFTGLNDGKGGEVFEGDIFEIMFKNCPDGFMILGQKTVTTLVNGVVVFKFGGFHVEFTHPDTKELSYVELFKLLKNDEKVVIGNIYENPKLVSNGRDQ